MLNCSAHFCLGSLALLAVQSSMGLTQPTWTYHTLLSPPRMAQQETLSVWYWGREWTPQLCTTTLCLQLVEMWLWECKGPSQHQNIVSMYNIYYPHSQAWRRGRREHLVHTVCACAYVVYMVAVVEMPWSILIVRLIFPLSLQKWA